MSIDEVVNGLVFAINQSDGDEKRVYKAMLEYIRTGDQHYLHKAKKYYNKLDYYEQQRAAVIYEKISEYY